MRARDLGFKIHRVGHAKSKQRVTVAPKMDLGQKNKLKERNKEKKKEIKKLPTLISLQLMAHGYISVQTNSAMLIVDVTYKINRNHILIVFIPTGSSTHPSKP